MADVVDFPSEKRNELLVWQCNCGSRSFRLLSDHSAVCNVCDTESAGVFGYWRIQEITPSDLHERRDNVVPLYADLIEQARQERAMFEAVRQTPLARGILERGGAIICSAGSMWEG